MVHNPSRKPVRADTLRRAQVFFGEVKGAFRGFLVFAYSIKWVAA